MEVDILLKETLGLSDFQILVYTTLLERQSTAGQLIKRLNINRATLYRVLDELVELNLLIKKQSGTRMIFEAMHPDALLEMFKRKRIAFEEKSFALERVVHELINKAKTQPTDASISIEKGVMAHYRSMKLQLTCKEKIIRQKISNDSSIYSYKNYPETGDYLKFMHKYMAECVRLGIHTHILVSLKIPASISSYNVTDPTYNHISKALPEEIFPNISFRIFDEYVIFSIRDKNPEDNTIITIRNRTTADFLKSMFDFIFDRSILIYKEKPIETIKTKEHEVLSKIGMGTAGVGGFWNARHPFSNDISDLDQMRFSLSKGINYIDNCLMYAEGHATELVGRAIKNFPRKSLFINGKLTRVGGKLVSNAKEIETQCNQYLKSLGTDYLDVMQIHSPGSLAIPEEEVVQKFEDLISAGKIRYWGVSNYNKSQLVKIQNYTKYPIFCNEVPFGVYAREYEKDGTLDYMRAQNILTISYFSILKGVLGINQFLDTEHPLVRIATKYRKTPAQVAINWVLSHPFTIAIIKATNGTHINENIGALGWELEKEDLEMITGL